MTKDNIPTIAVDHVGKPYTIYDSPQDRIKQAVLKPLVAKERRN